MKMAENGLYHERYSRHLLFLQKLMLKRLRNENEDKTKTQMTQSFNQYSENETKILRQNILNQFNRVSASCLRSHFVTSLLHSTRTPAFRAASRFFETIEEVLAFFFQNCRKFL